MAEKYSIKSMEDFWRLRNIESQLNLDNTTGALKFFLSEGHLLNIDSSAARTAVRGVERIALICGRCHVIYAFDPSKNWAEYPGLGPTHRCPNHR